MKDLKKLWSTCKHILPVLAFSILVLNIVTTGCSDDEDKVFYTVTFDTDGGTPVPSSQQVEAGKTATGPSTNPAKAGYVFMFWHLSGATTAYNFQTPVSADITLYARWQEETAVEYWQVSWELNGGAWPEDDNHTTQVVKGGTLAEPAAPVRTGYTFGGWYNESALSNQVSFPYDVTTVTSDFTLYAKWKKEEAEEKGTAMVAMGKYSRFILMADGSLYAAGLNSSGQLGTGNNDDVDQSTQVATGVAAVYAGAKSTFIVKNDGSVLATGDNSIGQLGLGDETNRNSFTAVQVDNVKQIAVGSIHTLLLKNDGSVWGTGNTYYGQMGTGDPNPQKTFTASTLTSDVIAIAAGSEHSIALKKDGTVWGAGYGNVGSLGENATDTQVLSFVQIGSDAKGIAANRYHSFILKKDGTVYATGLNYFGMLGIGSDDDVKAFTPVLEDSGKPLTNVTAMAAGGTFTLALKADGTLWATGNNQYGQLLGSVNRNSFIKIIDSDVKSISAGHTQGIIIKNDGTTATFGYLNIYDQLGGSSTIHIKVNDTRTYRWIKSTYLYDRTSSAELLFSNETIATGGSGYRISVKPGTYNLKFNMNHMSTPFEYSGVTVRENETVTMLYEYTLGPPSGYQWVLSWSK